MKDEERIFREKWKSELSEFELYPVCISFFVPTCQFLLSYLVVGTSEGHSAFFSLRDPTCYRFISFKVQVMQISKSEQIQYGLFWQFRHQDPAGVAVGVTLTASDATPNSQHLWMSELSDVRTRFYVWVALFWGFVLSESIFLLLIPFTWNVADFHYRKLHLPCRIVPVTARLWNLISWCHNIQISS